MFPNNAGAGVTSAPSSNAALYDAGLNTSEGSDPAQDGQEAHDMPYPIHSFWPITPLLRPDLDRKSLLSFVASVAHAARVTRIGEAAISAIDTRDISETAGPRLRAKCGA